MNTKFDREEFSPELTSSMMLNLASDDALLAELEIRSKDANDFWSFSKKTNDEHINTYFQYPAMMVPQMLFEILNALESAGIKCKSVFDPFMGAGTTMIEAMLHGIDFVGFDINPLAYLVSCIKSGPYLEDTLRSKAENLIKRIKKDTQRSIDISFPKRDKWFKRAVASKLSVIRRSIMQEEAQWARSFFWIVLAEVVRQSSNSRTSTFKLHIRPKHEISNRKLNINELFRSILHRNIEHMAVIQKALMTRGKIAEGNYSGNLKIILGDLRKMCSNIKVDEQCDCLITSPPYGDNRSTVPYGQFSYLPLQWIDSKDIHPAVSLSYIANAYCLDTASLGGRLNSSLDARERLESLSPTLAKTLTLLDNEPHDRVKRVLSFFSDFENSIDPILTVLKKDAYMFWIIGNRKVGGQRIPFDIILQEFLRNRGCISLISIPRHISSKRMAIRNNIADTMRTESIVVLRKATA